MSTTTKLEELYAAGKNREVIAAVKVEKEDLNSLEGCKRLALVAWAHHQLGEYEESTEIARTVSRRAPSASPAGESARRCLAHGLLQKDGAVGKADQVLQSLLPSLSRDNLRMNLFLMAVRKELEVPAGEVMAMISQALESVPYETVNAHLINNGTMVLHEAREQEAIRPYVPAAAGLMEVAIGIYEATGAAKNHVAGALFRASQIFEVAGWLDGAQVVIRQSVSLWQELVEAQGGERFQQNLQGALDQRERLCGTVK